jgi:hydroxyacylglutathione hydrolase
MAIFVKPKLTRLSFRKRRSRRRGRIILISIFLLVLAGFAYLQYLFLTGFYPTPTGRVAGNLYAAKAGYSTVYLYRDGASVVAVDAGDQPAALRTALSQLKIDPLTVSAVFLTHADYDHVAGLDLFKQAALYLSAAEAPLADGKQPRFFGLIRNRKLTRAYRTLHDGETVQIGAITVQAVATPGHTTGSMSYLLNQTALCTGDALALRDGRARSFYRVFNMDESAGRKSLAKLAALPNIAVLATAHTGFTTDVPRALREYAAK